MHNGDLKVGHPIYKVEEKSNLRSRQKIYKTIDGVEWHRYDTPLREYVLKCGVIVGRIDYTITGEFPKEEYELWVPLIAIRWDDEDKIHTEYADDILCYGFDAIRCNYEYYENRKDAEIHKLTLEKEAKELERQ